MPLPSTTWKVSAFILCRTCKKHTSKSYPRYSQHLKWHSWPYSSIELPDPTLPCNIQSSPGWEASSAMILLHIYSSVAVFQAYTLIRSNQRIWVFFYYTSLISSHLVWVLWNEIHLHNLTTNPPRHFSASPRCFHFPWLKTASWLRAPRCRQTWCLHENS